MNYTLAGLQLIGSYSGYQSSDKLSNKNGFPFRYIRYQNVPTASTSIQYLARNVAPLINSLLGDNSNRTATQIIVCPSNNENEIQDPYEFEDRYFIPVLRSNSSDATQLRFTVDLSELYRVDNNSVRIETKILNPTAEPVTFKSLSLFANDSNSALMECPPYPETSSNTLIVSSTSNVVQRQHYLGNKKLTTPVTIQPQETMTLSWVVKDMKTGYYYDKTTYKIYRDNGQELFYPDVDGTLNYGS